MDAALHGLGGVSSDADYRALALCRELWEAGLFAVFARSTKDGGAIVVAPTHIEAALTAQVLRQIADRLEQGDYRAIARQ